MRTVHSADIMQPCEDVHHNRKSPSGFTLAAKGPKGPNGESKHNRRPPLTLQQVLVLREARRSKGQRRKRSRDLGVSLGGVGLFPLKSPSATFVVLSSYPVEKLDAPGRASAAGTTVYSGEASEHLSVKLSPLIHIQQNSEESKTLESCIGGNWTF